MKYQWAFARKEDIFTREDNLLSHVKRSLLLWFRTYARPCNILYVFHGVCIINRILQAAWNYEISLRVLKNISLVRFAHSWNIFSTFEEEFRTSALPYNILLSPDKLSSKKYMFLKEHEFLNSWWRRATIISTLSGELHHGTSSEAQALPSQRRTTDGPGFCRFPAHLLRHRY